jgi:hypothetical protein
MRKIPKAIVLLFCIFLIQPALLAYPKEDLLNLQVPAKIAKGKIVDIDRMSSKITIKAASEGKEAQDMTFAITWKTKIIKDRVYVSLTSLMTGNEVVIEYYDNPKAPQPPEAKSIELF